ncbi:hypothetical protein HanRHA438_Chr09g0373021 [Helianthus annuus]|nr:hypothetical protein HanRHA438_Chr09g0373021 [Helianthus annuus]
MVCSLCFSLHMVLLLFSVPCFLSEYSIFILCIVIVFFCLNMVFFVLCIVFFSGHCVIWHIHCVF